MAEMQADSAALSAAAFEFDGIRSFFLFEDSSSESRSTYQPDTADGTQSGDAADINIGVGELQECTISKSDDGVAVDDLFVNAVISEADYAGGDAGTKGSGLPNARVVDLQLDQNFDVMAGTALPSVTDIIIDPYNRQAGEVGDMNSFVFEDSTSGAGATWTITVTYSVPSSTDSDFGDGKDALAMYQPDTVDTDLSLSAADVVIPATLAEYGLLLA